MDSIPDAGSFAIYLDRSWRAAGPAQHNPTAAFCPWGQGWTHPRLSFPEAVALRAELDSLASELLYWRQFWREGGEVCVSQPLRAEICPASLCGVWWDVGPALLFWSILGLVCVQKLSLILTTFQL